MFALVLIGLLILGMAATFAFLWYLSDAPTTSLHGNIALRFLELAAALLVVLVITCHTMIPSNNMGVIRTFGVVNVKRSYAEGFHLKWPWEKVEAWPLAYVDMDMTGDKGSYESIANYTSDKVWVDIPLSVRWRTDPANVLLMKSKHPEEGVYTAAVYRISRDAAKTAISEFSWSDGSIMNRAVVRARINQRIEEMTTEYFRREGFGAASPHMVDYAMTTIRSITPSADIETALTTRAANAVASQNSPVPNGMTPEGFARVTEAQAVRNVAAQGKPITVVVGGAAVVGAPK